MTMHTVSDLERLVAAEKARLKKKAADAVAEAAGAGSKKGAGEAPPSAAKKRRVAGDADAIEVIGDDGRGRGKAVDEISVPYICWGYSQKVQMAGTEFFVCRTIALCLCCHLPPPEVSN